MDLIIVTGSSRGIGEALASALVSPQTRVVGLARGRSERLAAIESQGLGLRQVAADLAGADLGVAVLVQQIDAALAELGSAELGRAVLINNAGIVDPIGQGEQLPAGDIARACLLNIAAPMALTSAFLSRLRGRAGQLLVLNISSGAGRRPIPGWSVYCATKAGLDLYSQTLAAEESARGAQGARVVSLAPGVVDTAMQGRIRSQDAAHFPGVSNFVALKNDGMLAGADEVALRVAGFLQSPQFGAQVLADIREFK